MGTPVSWNYLYNSFESLGVLNNYDIDFQEGKLSPKCAVFGASLMASTRILKM